MGRKYFKHTLSSVLILAESQTGEEKKQSIHVQVQAWKKEHTVIPYGNLEGWIHLRVEDKSMPKGKNAVTPICICTV